MLIFSSSVIYDMDFSKSSFKNVKFDSGSCYYCNFEGIDITEIKITKDLPAFTNFAGSSFRNVDFRDWEFGTVDFSGKQISGCISVDHDNNPATADRLQYETIPVADLTGANFSGMDLKDITFVRNNNPGIAWNDVNFSFADLSFHDLRNMSLKNANFSNADLIGVDFTNVDLENANFSDAILNDAILDCYNHEICN